MVPLLERAFSRSHLDEFSTVHVADLKHDINNDSTKVFPPCGFSLSQE